VIGPGDHGDGEAASEASVAMVSGPKLTTVDSQRARVVIGPGGHGDGEAASEASVAMVSGPKLTTVDSQRARLVIGPGGHRDCEASERSERRHGLGAEAHEGVRGDRPG
jgi:hypothetical protein